MLCSDNDFVACICVQTCTGDLEWDQSNSCLILLFSPPYCIVWPYFVLVIRTKLCFRFPSCSLSQTICQLLPNTAFSVYWKLKGFFFLRLFRYFCILPTPFQFSALVQGKSCWGWLRWFCTTHLPTPAWSCAGVGWWCWGVTLGAVGCWEPALLVPGFSP